MKTIKLKLSKLYDHNIEAKRLRVEEVLENWENIEEVLYYQNLFYVSKIIWFQLISYYHNDSLAGHCAMNKIYKSIAKKYY